MGVDLRDRTSVVTGAARGLGAAITRRLADAGSTVWAADLREEKVKELCEELEAQGAHARPLILDIRDSEQVEEAIAEVTRVSGGVDVLVNNAAVDVTKPIEHLSAQEADL